MKVRMRHEKGLQHANDTTIGASKARDSRAHRSSHVDLVEM